METKITQTKNPYGLSQKSNLFSGSTVERSKDLRSKYRNVKDILNTQRAQAQSPTSEAETSETESQQLSTKIFNRQGNLGLLNRSLNKLKNAAKPIVEVTQRHIDTALKYFKNFSIQKALKLNPSDKLKNAISNTNIMDLEKERLHSANNSTLRLAA